MMDFFDVKMGLITGTVLSASLIGHLIVRLFLWMANVKVKEDNGNGKWLGFVERALIALFVCLDLTSQTVFIFGVKAAVLGYRLPEDKDHRRNMAEYMLLGTMFSYFIALSIGLLGNRMIKILVGV